MFLRICITSSLVGYLEYLISEVSSCSKWSMLLTATPESSAICPRVRFFSIPRLGKSSARHMYIPFLNLFSGTHLIHFQAGITSIFLFPYLLFQHQSYPMSPVSAPSYTPLAGLRNHIHYSPDNRKSSLKADDSCTDA